MKRGILIFIEVEMLEYVYYEFRKYVNLMCFWKSLKDSFFVIVIKNIVVIVICSVKLNSNYFLEFRNNRKYYLKFFIF